MNQPPLFVQIDQVGASELRGSIRSHQATVDRPLAERGTELRPLGGEYLPVAPGGCLSSNLLAVARARRRALEDPGACLVTNTQKAAMPISIDVEGQP